MVSEQQAEAAIKKLRLMIEAAENSNQAGEDAVVAAAAGPMMLTALRPLAETPIGPEIEGDRDLVLYKNSGRSITVGDVLDARAAIAKAEGRTDA